VQPSQFARRTARVSSRDAHSAHSSVADPNGIDRSVVVELVFILAFIALYAVTHALIAAISRLGRLE
jgi:hypothetical protein